MSSFDWFWSYYKNSFTFSVTFCQWVQKKNQVNMCQTYAQTVHYLNCQLFLKWYHNLMYLKHFYKVKTMGDKRESYHKYIVLCSDSWSIAFFATMHKNILNFKFTFQIWFLEKHKKKTWTSKQTCLAQLMIY